MEKYIENDCGKVSKTQIVLFCIYIFLSFFETYLTRFFGNGTKFYLLFILAVFLYQVRFRIKVNRIWIFYLAWFAYKFMSISWSSMTNSDFNTHLLSQIGMLLFVIVMVGREQEKTLLYAILQSCLWVSFLFGVLSIFFRDAFLDEVFAARQVLTLFGQQNDPNNCAAFLLVGVTLALYSATIERKKVLLNTVIVAVNTYALMLTSSRAGFLTLGALIIGLVFLPQPGKHLQLKETAMKLGIIVVVVAITVFIVQKFLPQVNMDRLIIWSGYESGSGRDIRWQRSVELFLQKPLFGWGWSGYNTGVGAIHNTFLTSLCDVGIFGTVLFSMPLVLIGVESFRNKNNLALLLLMTGIFPSFALDAINKRFFWDAIVFSAMLITYQKQTAERITVWGFLDDGKA